MEFQCKNCNNGKTLVCKPSCQQVFNGLLHTHRCSICQRAGKYTTLKMFLFPFQYYWRVIKKSMPFKSKAQKSYLYANKPKVAKKFAKETPRSKKLPKRVKK